MGLSAVDCGGIHTSSEGYSQEALKYLTSPVGLLSFEVVVFLLEAETALAASSKEDLRRI